MKTMQKTNQENRGGKREGSGRKAKPNARKKNITVHLSEEEHAKLKAFANANNIAINELFRQGVSHIIA